MKLLLIMPNFFDYPEEIVKELENMGYEVDYFDDRPSTNGIVKAIIRINKEIINIYIRNYFRKMMKIIRGKKYDIIFLISGQSLSFSEDMFQEIRNVQPSAKYVLYQWDSLKNFPYIKKISQYFDICYSFDKDDVLKNSYLKFLPLFYTQRYEKIGKHQKEEYKYDFCFIGTAHPKKYKFIKMMSKQLYPVYSNQFIYYFFPSRLVYIYRKIKNQELSNARYKEFHFKSLRGEELDRIYTESKCILDCAQNGQTGLTIRVFEALGAKKKLITTNADVLNYEFYREENIYVYDGRFDYESPFFKNQYKELDKRIYNKYSLHSWLEYVLNVK